MDLLPAVFLGRFFTPRINLRLLHLQQKISAER